MLLSNVWVSGCLYWMYFKFFKVNVVYILDCFMKGNIELRCLLYNVKMYIFI